MNLSFKEQCIDLRKRGYSLTDIVKTTGRAKSSIHVHIKDIPLSQARVKEIRKASGERIKKFALARKGKSVRPFKPFDKWTQTSVSLIAHLLFDGGIYPDSGCVYNNRSESLIAHVEQCMCLVYAFKPTRYRNPLTGVSRISYHNVELATYMKSKGHELMQSVGSLPPRLKIEFVRAFFDDEGCLDYRTEQNRRSIRGYQKNIKVLRIIQLLLQDFTIESRVVLPNEVIITGKPNLIQFEKKINFSPGIYMNGKRSNSRWKKHIEKRALLRQAIASFKS